MVFLSQQQTRVTINTPLTAQTESGFVPNISVSSDVSTCLFDVNGTDSSLSNNLSSSVSKSSVNLCTFNSEIRFKNGVYNFTVNATDKASNVNRINLTVTVLDVTPPNTGTSISSSGTTTGATITITGINESSNVTVAYQSTGNTSFTGTTAVAVETDFSTTQTVSISGFSTVTEAVTFYYNVTVCDFNGNCNTNSTIFTFTHVATAKASTTTTTTSSGGGGGGGITAAVGKVADSKVQLWSTIPAGSSVTVNVNKDSIAIVSVIVTNVKSALSNVQVEVQALSSKPVTAPAAAKVFQYLKILNKNLAGSDAETIKITFRVPKSWLTENNLASGDIALYRYKNNKWNRISVTVTGTDVTYVNFESEVPGFSFFAVGSKTAASGELVAILDMIDSFYATGSPTLLDVLDAIDSYYSAGGA